MMAMLMVTQMRVILLTSMVFAHTGCGANENDDSEDEDAGLGLMF